MSASDYYKLQPGEIIRDDDFIFYNKPEGSGWTRADWINRSGTPVKEGERVIRQLEQRA